MSDSVTIKELVDYPPTEMISWAVMTLISHSGSDDFLKHFGIDASKMDNTVTVELKINGVEVSPREVFTQLDLQHTDMVKRQAMQMIQEKCQTSTGIIDLLQRLELLVKREVVTALGADWEDRW